MIFEKRLRKPLIFLGFLCNRLLKLLHNCEDHFHFYMYLCQLEAISAVQFSYKGTISHLRLANLKGLVILVDNRQCRPAGSGKSHRFGVGCQLYGSLACYSITGVEHHTVRNGTEHGNVLKGHLGRTISTCGQKDNNYYAKYMRTFGYSAKIEIARLQQIIRVCISIVSPRNGVLSQWGRRRGNRKEQERKNRKGKREIENE